MPSLTTVVQKAQQQPVSHGIVRDTEGRISTVTVTYARFAVTYTITYEGTTVNVQNIVTEVAAA